MHYPFAGTGAIFTKAGFFHILAQKFLARQLIQFASRIEEKAFDDTVDVDALMQEAEGTLFEISQKNMKDINTFYGPYQAGSDATTPAPQVTFTQGDVEPSAAGQKGRS